jgi:DNA-binding protein H-NS
MEGNMARGPTEQKTADEIIAQLEGLDASHLGRIIDAAASLRATKQAVEREAFIASIKEQAAQLNLDPATVAFMLMPTSPPRKAAADASRKRGKGVVAAQFRSPDGQHEWSGRGKSPKWLGEAEKTGRSREDFRIKENQPDLIEQARREHGEA